MADLHNQFRYSVERSTVELFGSFSVGESGAATLDAAKSLGIDSVERSETVAGNYTITFSDSWRQVLAFDAALVVATGAPAAPDWHLVSADGSTVVVQFGAQTGESNAFTATDPAEGEVVMFRVSLSD